MMLMSLLEFILLNLSLIRVGGEEITKFQINLQSCSLVLNKIIFFATGERGVFVFYLQFGNVDRYILRLQN